MSAQRSTAGAEMSAQPAANSPESTDNYAQVCWVIRDAAESTVRDIPTSILDCANSDSRYHRAHRGALQICNNAYTQLVDSLA